MKIHQTLYKLLYDYRQQTHILRGAKKYRQWINLNPLTKMLLQKFMLALPPPCTKQSCTGRNVAFIFTV
jgi:hypothetical protein